jgi:hypothetical protein
VPSDEQGQQNVAHELTANECTSNGAD